MSARKEPLKSYKKFFGAEGERLAAKYLESRGYTCVCKNFTTRRGEIDLIFRKDQTLAFCEVKTMTEDSVKEFGRAANKVTPEKMRRIALTAQLFLERNRSFFADCTPRFDVLEVTICRTHANIRHTKNAFPAPAVFIKKRLF